MKQHTLTIELGLFFIIIFFEGLYFSKKLNMENFEIKTRILKSLMEEEIIIRFYYYNTILENTDNSDNCLQSCSKFRHE